MATVAKVVVDVPTMQTNQPYDYAIPADMVDQAVPGVRVVVSFGKGTREVMGVIVATTDQQDFDGELKPVLRVLDDHPILDAELLALSRWLADDTFAFWITCLQAMLPSALHADTKWLANGAKTVGSRGHVATEDFIVPLLAPDEYTTLAEQQRRNATRRIKLLTALAQWAASHDEPRLHAVVGPDSFDRATVTAGAKQGWLRIESREFYRRPYAQLDAQARTQPLTPTPQQQRALDALIPAITAEQDRTFLLEGVTGSGKTEVYLQAIAATLARGRNALMLIPEIALTPQMVRNVKGRFGADVAVLHSALSDGERFDEWRRIERGEARVVVGARSAAFAPLTNIGLLIMDEEHETSYKQDDAPRYHARDVLQWRGAYNHAPVLLGSATPSLESRARAAKGVYTYLLMPERANQRPLPPVQVVDMRSAQLDSASGDFSTVLLNALRTRLDRHEQSVLMLNRRGFSSFVMCRECGYVAKCPNCDISLTLHLDSHTLRCHYCGHEEAVPTVCPSCGSRRIRYYGTGTEKVEQTLHQILPEARVLRMDVDTTRRKGGHAKILKAFGQHQADILLGTQMIAKGLDFPDVTLVGVINADTSLGLPDFRASERTFQLLTQVSGRAGRADKAGAVIVQTYNPDHYAIQLARHHDYERFFVTEMGIRHRSGYPPYYFTFKLTVSHPEDRLAAKAIYQLAAELKQSLSDQAVMLGPTRGAIARLKRRYYYQIVIKYKKEPQLHETLERLLTTTQVGSRNVFQIAFDREPLSFV
ncbi:primosomal replication protein n [Lacticaseibacillus thailandensis DSM 22698 = JCM 13996]|uniref:Replication restart protein PriA n=1 Tax=Lacticaseibacillus thailandensis DSM 22698 = JCM 13996 TaxID=1423810 RepID=A0A0R2CA47_9LACO|nr:primosomal protein N' [Lacticaseibacillus thailandensis]KRM88250.1 primosomal replication protein n [Lacticaseibacillus thailandensis DSM 22698 = JCM 13996]